MTLKEAAAIRKVMAVTYREDGTKGQRMPWYQVIDESGRVLYATANRDDAVAWIARRTR